MAWTNVALPVNAAINAPTMFAALANASIIRVMIGIIACRAGSSAAASEFLRYSVLVASCEKLLFAPSLPRAIFCKPSRNPVNNALSALQIIIFEKVSLIFLPSFAKRPLTLPPVLRTVFSMLLLAFCAWPLTFLHVLLDVFSICPN